MKWEYQYFYLTGESVNALHPSIKHLNELGAKGWEVLTIDWTGYSDVSFLSVQPRADMTATRDFSRFSNGDRTPVFNKFQVLVKRPVEI